MIKNIRFFIKKMMQMLGLVWPILSFRFSSLQHYNNVAFRIQLNPTKQLSHNVPNCVLIILLKNCGNIQVQLNNSTEPSGMPMPSILLQTS